MSSEQTSDKELGRTRELVQKITKIVETQHRKKADKMTDGQLKSLHSAYDWIAKANANLDRAVSELNRLSDAKLKKV